MEDLLKLLTQRVEALAKENAILKQQLAEAKDLLREFLNNIEVIGEEVIK